MANFKQAVKWLESRKKVRRPKWKEDSYWKLGMDNSIQWTNGTSAHIHVNQINATDFEVYEEKESVEDFLKEVAEILIKSEIELTHTKKEIDEIQEKARRNVIKLQRLL